MKDSGRKTRAMVTCSENELRRSNMKEDLSEEKKNSLEREMDWKRMEYLVTCREM
jgi:hypothetical protein